MDYSSCNVVYVDRTAKEDRLIGRKDSISSTTVENFVAHETPLSPTATHQTTCDVNVRTLLETFSEVYVCTNGKSCIAKVSELNHSSTVELVPTLVLIDIPYDEQLLDRPLREVRTPSPNSNHIEANSEEDGPVEDAYGLSLLQWVATEIQYQSLSRLIVPVAVCAPPPPQQQKESDQESQSIGGHDGTVDENIALVSKRRTGFNNSSDQTRTIKYLDTGAVDVLTHPLVKERLPSLAVHAYRAHKDALKEHRAMMDMKRGRKRSWVGVDDAKPYAYLREAMVSGLMDGICKLGGEHESYSHVKITVEQQRRQMIAEAVGAWHFSAHDFTDDELLHAASIMLQHALTMPELEHWRLSTETMTAFLVASRSAYNAFVPYHNFRHVVDVLQAIFHFLVQLGRLPPYPYSKDSATLSSSPIAALIRPFDALTLLITAIGHDVGHPGVNNAFLVTLNAPLAQLYNDRSVLESFHCAAYSQILRRYWPAAFSGSEMRQLMINSILATDMGLHFDYMKRMGQLEEKFHENKNGTDGWNGRMMEEHRTLACSLLIKCADISNVARTHSVATQWTMILTDEFSRQASMERDLGIPTALFAAPVREIVALGKSQIGFMNMFAIPLFQGVTNIMPEMQFCVDELHQNVAAWEGKIAAEQERKRQDSAETVFTDGMLSPRTMSTVNPFDAPAQKSSGSNSHTMSPETDLRKSLFAKSPFGPKSKRSSHEDGDPIKLHLHRVTSGPLHSEPLESHNPSPNESVADPESRRSSSKPQVQTSYATGSIPGLSGSDPSLPTGEGTPPNDVDVTPSLVTDPVLVSPPINDPKPPAVLSSPPVTEDQQETPDESKDIANSLGEAQSQTTNATTGQAPLSPSTKGTSLASRESDDRATPKGNGQSLVSSPSNSNTSNPELGYDGSNDANGVRKTLRKKSSRFRMNSLNFWKRNKSSSPPVPSVPFNGANRHQSLDNSRL